VNPQDCPFVW